MRDEGERKGVVGTLPPCARSVTPAEEDAERRRKDPTHNVATTIPASMTIGDKKTTDNAARGKKKDRCESETVAMSSLLLGGKKSALKRSKQLYTLTDKGRPMAKQSRVRETNECTKSTSSLTTPQG